MCGIAGGAWLDHPKKLEERLDKALFSMRFRGPNDQGSEILPTKNAIVALAHTRLSIIDLSASGHQPMHSNNNRYSIVFNGEIYNYRELRTELKGLGYVFKTETDTEVLLVAWSHWGCECLSRLIGMFAFAVFDKSKQTITCVRDPFGIKPFFYNFEDGNFIFASEINAIKQLKSGKVELDWQRSYDYLVHGDYDSTARSFIRNVNHLMPGHYVEFNLSTKKLSNPIRYWTPDVTQTSKLNFNQAAEELREKFLTSVRLHLRSDVAIGAALSGGVDSSAVVCAMHYLEPDLAINTFSYIAKDTKLSEGYWVDSVNQFVGATPHKIFVDQHDLINDLDDMIFSQGEPFGSTSIYAQYRVFKLAKESGVTVTLDGQGADELLAGYHGYPGKRFRSLIDDGNFYNATSFLINWSSWPGRTFFGGLKYAISDYVDGEVYSLLRRLHGDSLAPEWINKEILSDSNVQLLFPIKNIESVSSRRLVSELAFSLTERGLPSLLRHGDRNSMRFSIESRVPFLTTDIADFLLSLPEEYLISNAGETKSIFRKAMRGIVPDNVLDRRDKIGFATPERDLLIAMSEQIRLWLSEDIKLPFLNQKNILKEFELIVSDKKIFSSQVWRWVNFIRWYQLMFLL
jgi:asparagine synthase (glutamine-hydrolysing)